MSEPDTSRRARGFLRGMRLAGGLALLAILALQLTGCITADGVLRADGTATLTLTYAASPGESEAAQRARLTAPGITLDSLSIAPDRTVTAALRVTDLAAIGKTALLKDARVTTSTEGEVTTLTIAVTVRPPPQAPDESLPGPSIRITVPGAILDATEQGVVDGASVQWAFRLRAWLARPDWRLGVRYRPAPAPAPAPATPGGAPGTAKPE